mmetsp:Transcript_25687/g.84569  ORF Transcript_25687/g.84569 Transcript_25687/m.84569 type:complete len:215 (+) Transcript_25687:129-773(+)
MAPTIAAICAIACALCTIPSHTSLIPSSDDRSWSVPEVACDAASRRLSAANMLEMARSLSSRRASAKARRPPTTPSRCSSSASRYQPGHSGSSARPAAATTARKASVYCPAMRCPAMGCPAMGCGPQPCSEAAAAAGRPQPCPSLTQRLDEPVGGQAARGGDGRAAREADGVEGSLVAAEGRVLDHLRGGRVGGQEGCVEGDVGQRLVRVHGKH